jgi:hypothetical protein
MDKGYEVLGYYVHKDDPELKAANVMIVIEEGYERLTCYCPTEQHSQMDRGYFAECIPITKEEYLAASRSFYTPNDYLEDVE